VRELLRRQLREIDADPALRAYGVALCVCHLLAWLNWERTALPKLLSPGVTPVCWPFFEGCAELSKRSPEFWQWALYGYAGLSLLSGFWFWRARTKWALAAFVLLFGAHLLLLFQDFRLRLNQHTMLMCVGLAFLLAPSKRLSLRALVVSFYVFAGLLKLDQEWLSGAALGGHLPLFVPAALLPAACWYVVLLELVFVWGLFQPNKYPFWLALGQLALFHLSSFAVVGFFYPLLMAGLLSIFVLDRRFEPAPATPPRLLHAALVVVPFGLLQLLPLGMPGDSAVTGQGRFLALHMFDAKLSCRASVTLHSAGRPAQEGLIKAKLPGRIACDPLVYFHLARSVCQKQQGRNGFEDLDLKLVSKRQTGPVITVVDQKHFCTEPVHYSAWLPNAWIHGE
jgi:hypothetical protein